MSAHDDENDYWLDKPHALRWIYRGIWIVCGLLAVADFAYEHHPVFKFENFPAFYGIFAFVVGFALVLGARELRKVLKRDEDYYDR